MSMLQFATANTENARQIAFVLDNLDDWESLVANLSGDVLVHVLDASGDVLGQISTLLADQTDLSAIHLFGHGSAGNLNLGQTNLNANTLPAYEAQLARIGAALSADGDILLYGCDVAQGSEGAELIGRLAQITGADIAASTNTTGASARGGNWVLEAASGTVDVATLQVAGYAGMLAAPVIANFGDTITFTEGSTTPIAIDADVAFSGGVSYTGGFVRFNVSNPSSGDKFVLSNHSTPNANGAISVVGNDVYMGTGTGTQRIGSIDATENGQNGKALKILFSVPLVNGSFEDGATGSVVPGFVLSNERYGDNGTEINFNGYTIPLATNSDADSTYTGGTGTVKDQNPNGTIALNATVQAGAGTGGSQALYLSSSGSIVRGPGVDDGMAGFKPNGYGSIQGPYANSASPFRVEAGDSIKLDFKAVGSGDDYQVFGLLRKVNPDGSYVSSNLADTGTGTDKANVVLFAERGADTAGFKTVTKTGLEAGSYKFEFIGGTYDGSGGLVVGSNLYVDNIRLVPSATVDDAVLSQIALQVTFLNDAPDTLEDRTLTVTAANSSGEQGSASKTLSITQANNAPELSASSVTASFVEDAVPTAATGKSVSAIFGPAYADPDNVIGSPDPLSGIVVVGNTSDASGTWQYSLDNGATWQAVGTVSDAAGLWLPSTALLILTGPENWRGNATPELTVHLVDSSTGAPTASPVDVTSYKGVADSRHPVSAGSYTVKAVVTATNDAPVYVAGGTSALPTVTEDVTMAANTGAQVSTLVTGTRTDVDTAAGGPLAGEFADGGIAIYATTSTAGAGKFQYSTNGGTTWVDAPALSTTSALLLRSTHKLRFQPDAAKGGTGSFSFYIWDGATGTAGSTANVTTRGGQTAFSQDGQTGAFTVTDVPDAPVALGISNTTTTGKGLHSYITGNRFSDPDGDALTYSYTATDGGSPVTLDWLSIDPATGTLSGNPPTPAGGKTYAITVTAKDPGNLSVSSTFNWSFTNTTDPLPVANSLDMTPATDSGATTTDNITNNGLPVLTFTGEPDLAPTLKGPDGTTLTLGQHYRIDYSAGTQTHTVILLDAQPGASANPFGSFNGTAATGNPASTADGTYELTVSNSDGSVVVGTFKVDTTAPTQPTITLQTFDTDFPVITGTVGTGALPAGETLTVTVNGATYENVVVAGDGSWNLNTVTATPKAGTSLGAFNAGAAYDVSAVVSDAAGNSSTDNTGGEFRKTAPPTKNGEGRAWLNARNRSKLFTSTSATGRSK